ncbi:B-box zinc finger protein 21-like protein [Tanacetum coccineum]
MSLMIQANTCSIFRKQDKRAFLFCKEDRAILCRQCDMSIHGANEHTQYHNRFLLAGVKLSASSSCYDSSCSSDSNVSIEIDSQKCSKVFKDQNARETNNSTSMNGNSSDGVSQEEGVSMGTSSFSEYLMETLPGWHLDEFLDPSASHPYGFYEAYDSGTCTLPFMAHESDNNEDFGTLWSEDLGILVNSSSSSMDHYTSRSSTLSKRLYCNDMEGLNKDQYTFNSSSKRPRQLW